MAVKYVTHARIAWWRKHFLRAQKFRGDRIINHRPVRCIILALKYIYVFVYVSRVVPRRRGKGNPTLLRVRIRVSGKTGGDGRAVPSGSRREEIQTLSINVENAAVAAAGRRSDSAERTAFSARYKIRMIRRILIIIISSRRTILLPNNLLPRCVRARLCRGQSVTGRAERSTRDIVVTRVVVIRF